MKHSIKKVLLSTHTPTLKILREAIASLNPNIEVLLAQSAMKYKVLLSTSAMKHPTLVI
jgi:hypothetical protein